MSVSTEIFLARHGETDWNAARRFQGQTDIGLNARGLDQATRLAERTKDLPIAAVYSSDLSRASATAAPSAALHGLSVIEDIRLRERHYGMFEGRLYADIELQLPDAYRLWQTRDPDFDLGGGESLKQVAARCQELLDAVALRHPGESVLIVTHGGVLDLAYRHVLRLTLETPRAWATPNAAFNHVRYAEGQWHLVLWADEQHLAD